MKKYSKETTVGLFVLIGLLLIVYMSVKLGDVRILSDSHYHVSASFNDISGLRINAPVEIMGVPVGFVDNISLNLETQKAVVGLSLEKKIELTDDAIASIKTSGLIGDKYVKIALGGVGDPIEPGGTIIETESAIDVEDLISKYVFGKV
ncbi:phospholipid/cholesterol/gamma-HCH transport system substrate-binding protein [Maridesulfovibrio ferrireducens]|uniref:Phospholipid/cholesterol/gamma-HCH transport system substrate-binding protein n=1 Tax=Maridesulfovibrio ferrireducens TaxID=246191 RepID=A0A1G9BJJ2_9BACT|nr:outer membrane lipid asymmetry maintenance protein MlaD [Maridesulfovibrio ferrireducens]SDK39652.1 phospholipid/cholesterol/gamma-HCH transport system substrate-binding protein [Maridesulfovibrio ferrireducens]